MRVAYSAYDFDIATYSCDCGHSETGDVMYSSIKDRWEHYKDGKETIKCPKCGKTEIPEYR